MVARVARAICAAALSNLDKAWIPWDAEAEAALEASHHAELVEAGSLVIASQGRDVIALGMLRDALAKIGDRPEVTRCRAPGCQTLTDRDICDHCDDWVTEQAAKIGGDA